MLVSGFTLHPIVGITDERPDFRPAAHEVEEIVEVSIDDKRYGVAGPSSNLRIPGLASGTHKVQGSRMGYDPVSVGGLENARALEDFALGVLTKIGRVFYRFAPPGEL